MRGAKDQVGRDMRTGAFLLQFVPRLAQQETPPINPVTSAPMLGLVFTQNKN